MHPTFFAIASTFGVIQAGAWLLAQGVPAQFPPSSFDPMAFISGLAGTGVFGSIAVICWIASENIKHKRMMDFELKKLQLQAQKRGQDEDHA